MAVVGLATVAAASDAQATGASRTLGTGLPDVTVPGSLSPLTRVAGGIVQAPPAVGGVTSGPKATTAAAGPKLTVTPDTNLTNDEKVTATGSGMAAGAYGALIECNQANGEPTVQVEGNAVPVGCTNPLSTIQVTSSSGTFTATFTIKTGDIGPPASGTDSAGDSASTDAAKYPCPPTPAQQAAGATCDLSYGDTSGDQVSTPLGFAAASSPGVSAPGPTTPSSAASSSSSGTAGSSVGASGQPATAAGGTTGSLAYTGIGPGVQQLAISGLVLLVTGSLLIFLAAARLRYLRRSGS